MDVGYSLDSLWMRTSAGTDFPIRSLETVSHDVWFLGEKSRANVPTSLSLKRTIWWSSNIGATCLGLSENIYSWKQKLTFNTADVMTRNSNGNGLPFLSNRCGAIWKHSIGIKMSNTAPRVVRFRTILVDGQPVQSSCLQKSCYVLAKALISAGKLWIFWCWPIYSNFGRCQFRPQQFPTKCCSMSWRNGNEIFETPLQSAPFVNQNVVAKLQNVQKVQALM